MTLAVSDEGDKLALPRRLLFPIKGGQRAGLTSYCTPSLQTPREAERCEISNTPRWALLFYPVVDQSPQFNQNGLDHY